MGEARHRAFPYAGAWRKEAREKIHCITRGGDDEGRRNAPKPGAVGALMNNRIDRLQAFSSGWTLGWTDENIYPNYLI